MTSQLAIVVALRCVSFVQGDPVPHHLAVTQRRVLVDTQAQARTTYWIYANDRDGLSAGTRLAPDQVSSIVVGPGRAGWRRTFLQTVITNGTPVFAEGWCK